MTACSNCDLDSKYYVGDIGTVIIVNTCVDLSTATQVSLKVEKPDGTLATWPGTVYETNSIRYVVQDGDFDQDGEYSVQAYIKIQDWQGRGATATFRVASVFN
jgi:hypothetical protein